MFNVLRGTSGFSAVIQTGAATVLVLAVNVATGVIAARFLGAQGRGELAALLLWPQFLSFIFTFGFATSLIVNCKEHPTRVGGLIGAAVMLSTCAGVLGLMVGITIVPLMMRQYSQDIIQIAQWLLVFTITGVVSTVLTATLQLRDNFLAFNRVRYWQGCAILLSLLVLGFLGKLTPLTGALAYALPPVPFFIWNAWWVVNKFSPNLRDFRDNQKTLVGYGLRVYGIDAIGAIIGQFDKFILVALLAPSTFGVYAVVFNLSRLITSFATSATPVLLPRTAGQSFDEIRLLTNRTLSIAMPMTAAAAVAFVLLGKVVLLFMYGTEYVSGYGTLVVLSLEAVVASAALILQQPYMVLNQPGKIALFQALSLCIGGASVFVMSRLWGMEGAAIGLLLGTFARCSLTYWGYIHILALGRPRFVATRDEVNAVLNRLRAHK